MPKVSVNIPTFNNEKYISETIESVLKQTYNDYELIIIDDGSTDKTAEIIKKYKDERIKYYFQKNKGIGAARNAAIEKSSGEYIAFLDHDDLWFPKKLEKQMFLFESKPELGLVFCGTIFFNDKEDLYNIYNKYKPPRGMIFKELFHRYFLSLETVVIKKKVLDDIGLFCSHMMMVEEYDLFLRISYKYPIDYIDEPLAKYRIHEKNYSWGKEFQGIKEEMEVIERLRASIHKFDIDFEKEIKEKKKKLLLRECFALWKNGKTYRRKSLSLIIESPNIKSILFCIMSFFISYKIFRQIINLFPNKHRNPFMFDWSIKK